MSENKKDLAGKKGGKLVLWVGVIVVLVVAGFLAWKYFKGSSSVAGQDQSAATAQTQAPVDPAAQAAAVKEVQATVSSVSKFIILPNETPTVATILDAKKLTAEQTFYTGSLNGDKLLVYPKSQKAIIYSPSRNILVNVGPVYFNNSQPAGQPAAEKGTASSSKK